MAPPFSRRPTAVFLLCLLAVPVAPSNAAAWGDRLVFILAGQSNMSGRGGVVNNTWDRVVPPQCRPNPSIQRLSAALQWEEARDPLHADIDAFTVCGVGPGMSFANAIRGARRLRGEVGLVPCAVGATKIEQWQKGTQLYEQMVRRARAAASWGRLSAVLWYQGESDAVQQADAQAYTGRMERMVQDLRADLGLPGLPVIQVLLATGLGPYVDTVRAAQRAVNSGTLRGLTRGVSPSQVTSYI
ncbi:hypothetical protein Taro_037727 [Colocasia esculenta]|uniref:Sialate O-acetylesterase domain-containing protein n=1 Tax=Colocasia esculenta TaxID=4460 RepID=A0A843W1D7_COLES|nr:hypothetical protein [Colocasia esculenta]